MMSSASGDDQDDGIHFTDEVTTSVFSSHYILYSMHYAFQGSLTAESPRIPQPPLIKTSLRPHQRAVVAAMLTKEKACMNGVPYKNTMTYSNYGILGDDVGSGKSLEILAYLAHLREIGGFPLSRRALYTRSSKNLFTVYDVVKKSLNPLEYIGSSLIVVPHTIFKQWVQYGKIHTELNILPLKTASCIPDPTATPSEKEEFLKKIRTADATIVSNTLYGRLNSFTHQQRFMWNRIFIDEVDSIYVPSTNGEPNAFFTWFISATWPNFLLDSLCIRSYLLHQYEQETAAKPDVWDKDVGEWLRRELGITSYNQDHHGMRSHWLSVRSRNWLRSYKSEHTMRGLNVILCRREFLKESQQMPLITDETILCEQPITQKALTGIISKEMEQMLHAGNIEGAFELLGVTIDDTTTLVDAVTKEREKELTRLKKTYAFKESMDYATPQAKELALASLKAKIHSVEEQLKTFRERLTEVKECPVCYENPYDTTATLTPCDHIFCGNCILSSLKRSPVCPMCRTAITVTDLKRVQNNPVVKTKTKKKEAQEENKLLSKPKQLLKFLRENPNAKVLVFNRYENPFTSLAKECEEANIKVAVLRGNKDCIDATIRSFTKGENRVLFLETRTMGAGLNLVAASHIVLFHAMTPEEEKQVVGRAYRLGRTEPLKIVRLLHSGETV